MTALPLVVVPISAVCARPPIMTGKPRIAEFVPAGPPTVTVWLDGNTTGNELAIVTWPSEIVEPLIWVRFTPQGEAPCNDVTVPMAFDPAARFAVTVPLTSAVTVPLTSAVMLAFAMIVVRLD